MSQTPARKLLPTGFAVSSSADALSPNSTDITSLQPSVVNLGTHAAGDIVTSDVILTNKLNSTLRITGNRAACNCLELKNLPIELGPKQSATISLILTVRKGSVPVDTRDVNVRYVVFVETNKQSWISGVVRCQVADAGNKENVPVINRLNE